MEFSEAFSPGRAITHGIEGIKRAPAGLLIGGFLMWLAQAGSGGGGGGGDYSEIFKGKSPEVSAAMVMLLVGVFAVSIVIGILAFLFRCWLEPGYYRLHRDVISTGNDSIGVLFSGADVFGRMFLWKLLSGVIGLGTMVASLLPGGVVMALAAVKGMGSWPLVAGGILMAAIALPAAIYVGLGLALGDRVVALEGLGPMATLDRSWELARGNRMTLFVFLLVTGLFSLVGLLACCVGMFVTRTIADVGTTEAFLLATVPEARDYVIPRELGL